MASEAKCKECWFRFKVERRHKIGESCPALAGGEVPSDVSRGGRVEASTLHRFATPLPSLAQVQAQKEATYTALVVPP